MYPSMIDDIFIAILYIVVVLLYIGLLVYISELEDK